MPGLLSLLQGGAQIFDVSAGSMGIIQELAVDLAIKETCNEDEYYTHVC